MPNGFGQELGRPAKRFRSAIIENLAYSVPSLREEITFLRDTLEEVAYSVSDATEIVSDIASEIGFQLSNGGPSSPRPPALDHTFSSSPSSPDQYCDAPCQPRHGTPCAGGSGGRFSPSPPTRRPGRRSRV